MAPKITIPIIAKSDKLASAKGLTGDGDLIASVFMVDDENNSLCCYCGCALNDAPPPAFRHSLIISYPKLTMAFRTCCEEETHLLGKFFNDIPMIAHFYLSHLSETLPLDWKQND